MSVWAELAPILQELGDHAVEVSYADWRPGDQSVCFFDIAKVTRELGWSPKVGVKEGVTKLYNWVQANKDLFL